jgi:hypothetical protein
MEILSDESQKRYNILSLKPIDGEKTYLQPPSQNIIMLKLDENLEKELYINNKIEKIPFYHLYFQTIHTKNQISYVNYNQLQKEEIPLEYWERVTTSNNNGNPFILVESSNNLTNSTSIRTYDEWLHKFDNKKELLSNVFNLCFFVLDGVQILKKHNIDIYKSIYKPKLFFSTYINLK